jgi:MOSC domain-containing protein YiiM
MSTPHVVSIHTVSEAGKPLDSLRTVNALAGQGLEGDRYAIQIGTFSKPLPDREVTLIEIEAIDALAREYDTTITPGQARRNIVTRGFPLNHMVGREFTIGSARFRGIRLCEPCGHLAKLTNDNVRKGLVHRGGLRAQVLQSGSITVGDPIAVPSDG